MESDERKAEIKRLERSVYDLQHKLNELEREDFEAFQVDARANIGRCFKRGDEYVKVIDVPQRKWLERYPVYNIYQYPAFYVRVGNESSDSNVPFYYDTFFSRNFSSDYVPIGKKPYKEILQEEFDAVFIEELNRFKDQVIAVAKRDQTVQ